MADCTVKRISEMETAFRGAYKRARAELGVESFGMQVLDFPANATGYPEHDHAHDGQEEVYVVLSGRGEIEVDGERIGIDPETIVRVGPRTRRKLLTGPDPMRVLALGGVPGEPYAAPAVTELGAPDPLAR